MIVPVLNGERTIAAAIDSALAQQFDGDLEVVVVNDGSNDGTAAVLDLYGSRVTVIVSDNRGQAAARNAGVRASHGEWIAFLDADDVWLPDKLARTVTALEANPDATLVYSDAEKIDAGGRRLGATCTPDAQNRAPSMSDVLTAAWNILPSTIVMSRAAFDRVGGFCEEFGRHPKWEDTWFTIAAREHGPFVYLAEPTVLYRVPDTAAQDLERRGIWKPGAADAQAMRLERYLECSELIQRLARERFGDRALRLRREIRKATSNLLVAAGLTAMVAGDRVSARRAYGNALRYRPLDPKIYLRLAWTLLPAGAARAIAAVLPPKLHRAVSGPARA
ncbi:MAG TPA: glycosyltransferase [Candidatus Acidoferrales bacterium]|nr:glycosyltransferase [Candidatus Acidoferrales bacterium]